MSLKLLHPGAEYLVKAICKTPEGTPQIRYLGLVEFNGRADLRKVAVEGVYGYLKKECNLVDQNAWETGDIKIAPWFIPARIVLVCQTKGGGQCFLGFRCGTKVYDLVKAASRAVVKYLDNKLFRADLKLLGRDVYNPETQATVFVPASADMGLGEIQEALDGLEILCQS